MENLQKINIRPGINLYYYKDDKYKDVSLGLYLHRKISRDEVTWNSLLAGVLRAGTEKCPTVVDINRKLESLYGAVSDVSVLKKGSVHSLCVSMSVIDERFSCENVLSDAVEMMLDFVFAPLHEGNSFSEKIVATEKQNLKDFIDGMINDKVTYATSRCLEIMCEGESAGINEHGYTGDLDKIDAVNLYEYYKKIIAESPIDIFITGSCDIEKLSKVISDYISRYSFDIKKLNIDTATRKEVTEKYIEEKFDVVQGKLVIGLRTNVDFKSDLYFPLIVGNSLFGEGTHSRLFNNVREKLSLAYYATSRINKYGELMVISSGIVFENFEKTRAEIFKELDNLKKGDYTEEEIRLSKNCLVQMFRLFRDNPFVFAEFKLGQILYDDEMTIDEVIERIESVTAEQIKEAFSRITPDTVYFLKGRD